MLSSRRKRQLVLLACTVGLFAGVESYFRLVHEPDLDLSRYLLNSTINVERWSFLAEHEEELLLGEGPERKRSVVLDVEPENERPPFDSVSVGYHLETNEDGFRERPFEPKKPGEKRIVLLGDSVSFGKGMERGERYSDRVAGELPEGFDLYNLSIRGCTTDCMRNVLTEFVSLDPDLLLFQASTNDMDRTLWRMAEDAPSPGASATLMKVLTWSRALLVLAWKLGGDPFPEAYQRAIPEMRRRYGESTKRLFELARATDAPVAVILVPMADNREYGVVMQEHCEAAGDQCLGILEVDFDEEGVLGEEGQTELRSMEKESDWVTETSELANLDEELVARIMTNRHFFYDVVHPNGLGNEVISAQLTRFLKDIWPPLQAN